MVNPRINVIGLALFLSFKVFASQDPTAPLNWVAPKVSSSKAAVKVDHVPTLQSIICNDESSCYAVLDDKLTHVNDMINGYRVSAITLEEVTVVKGNTSKRLALFISDIKK